MSAHSGSSLARLPIDALLEDLVQICTSNTRCVVEAPAGAGKTTRIPPALFGARLWQGETWVAEPRRIAARLMAHRVASEMQVPLGGLVGYSVRFDECASPATRIRYVTSGVLLRRLLRDRDLPGVDCVILDEFHERHLDTDLCLALLGKVQERRPQFRILVMSATLDGARIADLLGGCPRLTSEGRLYPLEISFEPEPDQRPLEKRISSAVRTQLCANPHGSILVFLPGAAEIRRTQNAISGMCQEANVELRVLHGDLPLDAQAAAIQSGSRPRVVLATNVAESSITVDGITAVIDSGLCRQLDCSPTSGLPRLTVQKISRASAIQRAGRAARIAPGRAIRLYTKGDFEGRPEFEVPEIARTDFSAALLLLCACKQSAEGPRTAPNPPSPSDESGAISQAPVVLDEWLFLDRPSRSSAESAYSLLRQLDAIDAACRLTEVGQRLVPLPLHPRLARLLVECERRGIPELGALAAALLSERDIRLSSRSSLASRDSNARGVFSGDSDVSELVERYLYCEQARLRQHELRDEGIDPSAFHAVRELYRQLSRATRCADTPVLDVDTEDALAKALLVAFPDRVAKRRAPGSREVVLRTGTSARLSDTSVVTAAEWLLAIEVEQRRDAGRSLGSTVQLASAISVDWLVDCMPEALQDEEELAWVDPPGRVESRSRIRLGSLLVDESRRPAKPGPQTAAVLRAVLDQTGVLKSDDLSRLSARLSLIAADLERRNLAVNPDELMAATLDEVLRSRIDLSGLDQASLAASILAMLPSDAMELLRSHAPEAIQLGGGRRCKVHYEAGRAPWIESRLQDFFGQSKVPTILGGRQKVVVHLLAPNQRAVQITDDLAGFWTNHYPDLRRQLLRRYPRHAWPEDGLTARPPDLRATRRD